jgi:membrane associated rhomboid family serine protease
MASIWDKLVSYFHRGNTTTRLIMVTVGVFLLLRIVLGLVGLFHVDVKEWLEWLLVPVSMSETLSRPWTLFTYMFVHYNLMHLLMNMVWLYVFGLFFQRWFTTFQMITHYIMGGVAGALMFVVGNQLLEPSGTVASQAPLIGASASVMTLAMGVAVLRPNEPISLFLLGTIKLKYLALIMIGLDLLGLNPDREGVMLAHLGGALYGVSVGLTSRRGLSLTGWFERLVLRFSSRKRRPKMRVTYRRSQKETTFRTDDVDQAYRNRVKQEENQLDSILDKVKQSGYDSLSKEEKKHLFDMSNRTNR